MTRTCCRSPLWNHLIYHRILLSSSSCPPPWLMNNLLISHNFTTVISARRTTQEWIQVQDKKGTDSWSAELNEFLNSLPWMAFYVQKTFAGHVRHIYSVTSRALQVISGWARNLILNIPFCCSPCKKWREICFLHNLWGYRNKLK